MQTNAIVHTTEAAPIGGSASQVTLFLVEIASQGLKRIRMMTNATVISCIYIHAAIGICVEINVYSIPPYFSYMILKLRVCISR